MVMASHFRPATNIGYPKLFTGGEKSGANISPPPPATNFAAGRRRPKLKSFYD
jgi:hypothetical protein